MKLKVCGLKYADNIKQVAELSPAYVGFIFYEGSKRFVGEHFVMPELSPEIKKVGVFVNAEMQHVVSVAKKYQLDFVQLHGHESASYCKDVSKEVKVIKAFGVDETFDFSILNDYANVCTDFLFDSKTESFGGSGKPFDWNLLKNYTLDKPYFIAGGMDAQKLRSLKISGIRPYGIDVNSRMEIKPGYKDIIKVIQISNIIKQ